MPSNGPSRSDASADGKGGSRGPAKGASVRTPGSILFIAAALVALALVPLGLEVRISTFEREIEETFEPAMALAADVASLHARQMSRFQEYLLTGSGAARRQYDRLRREEDDLGSELRAVLEPMDIRIRALFLPVSDASTAWQLGHLPALGGIEGPEAFRSQIAADRARYEALVRADGELRDALAREVAVGRRRVDEARRLEWVLTFALLAVALVATFAVAGLARRQRRLVREAEGRRAEAVRTRREVDAILAATADAVLSIDLEGRIERINPAAERLLGWSEVAARGLELRQVLSTPGDGSDPPTSPVEVALEAGEVVDGRESTVSTRGGRETRPVLWSLRPLIDGRDRRGAVLTLADLTEIKEAEARLRSAIRAREEVMAVVSHDLRSPLGSVSAATELLLEVPLDAEARARHLRGIERATARMNRLIEDLLDVARIDAGQLSVRPRPVDVDALVTATLEEARSESQEREVGLRRVVEVGEARPLVDPDRVGQLLQNLVGNALRHTPRGGTIEVRAVREDGSLRLEVEDSGCGIPADHIPHLFDRFWRPEGQEGGGAGLGLAIVKGIVEAHGGEIEVESRPGTGTRFRVRLTPSWTPTPATPTPGSS